MACLLLGPFHCLDRQRQRPKAVKCKHGPKHMFRQGCWCRGNRYIDGSLTDFINSNNSHLIHCNGEALILDYFQVSFCNLPAVLPELG